MARPNKRKPKALYAKLPSVKVLRKKAKAHNTKHHVKVSQKKSALYSDLVKKGGL